MNKKNLFKKMISSRIGLALFFNLIILCFLFPLAMIISLISHENFWYDTFKAFKVIYMFFGGSALVIAALLIFTKLEFDSCYHYGFGAYYGFWVIGAVINDFCIDDTSTTIISTVLILLICRVIFLKNKLTQEKSNIC